MTVNVAFPFEKSFAFHATASLFPFAETNCTMGAFPSSVSARQNVFSGWRTCLARTHRMLYGQENLRCYFQDRIGSHYQCLSFLLSTLNKMPCLGILSFDQVGMVPALVSCHCKTILLGKVRCSHNHCTSMVIMPLKFHQQSIGKVQWSHKNQVGL